MSTRRIVSALNVSKRLTRRARVEGGRSRRRFLAGASSLLALPALEMFHEVPEAHCQTSSLLRLVIYFLPNGRLPENWRPSTAGSAFDLPRGSESLAPFQSDLVFFSGLRNTAARASTADAGDHARGTSGVATCTPLDDFRSLDHDIRSVDQVLADAQSPDTRFQSLQYTAGEPWACDRGSSCVFTQAFSWAGANRPLTPLADPLSAFDQLFGGEDDAAGEEQGSRQRSLVSVLDYVTEEATVFSQTLGQADQAKFEEYMTSVQELERRLTTSTEAACQAGPAPGAALSYQDRVTAFHDLMALALECDQTRFISFMIEYGLSSRSHPELDAPGGHHAISHYTNDNDKQQLIRVENWQGDELGKFVEVVANRTEADGSSMLDNTLILAMPSMGWGNPHDHDDVSPIFIGKAAGAIQTGQYIDARGTPLGDLYVTLLQAFGVQASFGADGKNVISGVLA